MDTLNRHFGLVIAYLLPGFVALIGVAPFAPLVAGWLQAGQDTSVGAPIYAVLAATAAGMVVSCFRWLVVDRIHALTGLGSPAFNARALEERPAAFSTLVESHYRYYQFYANTMVAVGWSYSIYRWLTASPRLSIGTDLGVIALVVVLFAGSRDALAKYRNRTAQLAARIAPVQLKGGRTPDAIARSQGGRSVRAKDEKGGDR